MTSTWCTQFLDRDCDEDNCCLKDFFNKTKGNENEKISFNNSNNVVSMCERKHKCDY